MGRERASSARRWKFCPIVTRLKVPAQPSSAAVIRQRISADLSRAGVPESVVDDAVLVATELLSNALRHARALEDDHLDVSWAVEHGAVSITVTDGGGRNQPHVRHPGPADTNGRGLSIVETLADEWGVDEGDSTATVWARLRA
jgi:anti-sigma regulatory factor (Ser/Thr protein kinase)